MDCSTFFASSVLVLFASTSARADVTLTMTNSIEGSMVTATGTSAPRIVMRVQGLKSRTDVEVMGRSFATIIDVASKQMLMLDPAQKTARRVTPEQMKNPMGDIQLPKLDVKVEPTGRTQEISGQSCTEFRMDMTMDMGTMAGAQMPREMADAMKDLRMVMKGSTWIAKSTPAAAEFVKFQQAARAINFAVSTNVFAGQNTPDPLSQTLANTEGLPCLTEMEATYEGSGPMIDMLKKMGTMKFTSRLEEVSVAPIPADHFAVPADYTDLPALTPGVVPPRQ
jgi:hypothetical protein